MNYEDFGANARHDIFRLVERRSTQLVTSWKGFKAEMMRLLPESYHAEINDLTTKLEDGLEILTDELQNPTLILATTGTTSSGKSTLVNFLCGADIVPTAVSEMSAGVVTIEFQEEKSLVIHETPGANWECGEWRNISDEEIYDRLDQTMRNYIDNRDQNQSLACPQSIIRYPFKFIDEVGLELPKGTKIKIMDLPGLSHVGDETNAAVIRQCREALCLVTYNSAETDQEKMKNLLDEVVEQVKDLGGSPARMLFILNRIDVFRSDKKWPESETRFVNKTVASIKEKLLEQLGEYKTDIENLQVVKLSTMPALLGIQIQSNDKEQIIQACKKAKNNFGEFIEEITDELPGNVSKWTEHDRTRIVDELQSSSYAIEFKERLKQHIYNHFPQLVIPQIVDKFKLNAANEVIQWSVQTTSAIVNSSEEDYQKEIERIDDIRKSLNEFLEECDQKLREPFSWMEDSAKKYDSQYMDKFQEAVVELQKNYKEIEEKLTALYSWRENLAKTVDKCLESVLSSLEKGYINLKYLSLKKVKQRTIDKLESSLKEIINLGYTGHKAKTGYKYVAKTDHEKEKLRRLNRELNTLADNLNDVIEEILGSWSQQ
ncbi:MAG: dynamin family protein [Snowella sp.]|nr:dynamin family protein [Snowella sp.]